MTPEGNRWRLGFEREERFVATPTPYSEENERGFLAAVADHVDYCQAHGLPQRSQETYFIDAGAVASGDYRKGLHVATLVGDGVSSPRLHVKPAGTYLHWLNRIDLAQVERAPEGANTHVRRLRRAARGSGARRASAFPATSTTPNTPCSQATEPASCSPK